MHVFRINCLIPMQQSSQGSAVERQFVMQLAEDMRCASNGLNVENRCQDMWYDLGL